jgi:hypothetical protein
MPSKGGLYAAASSLSNGAATLRIAAIYRRHLRLGLQARLCRACAPDPFDINGQFGDVELMTASS